jgi:HEAT repeat protein
MTINELFADKSKKAKEKSQMIGQWLLEGAMPADELLAFAEKANDSIKATCIEAIEFATKQNPELADESVFAFATNALADQAPRVKWESAKVIGNIARNFPEKLPTAITSLLVNAEHEGTVVRWAAAYALGEILKLKTTHNIDLKPIIETICHKETDTAIKKKYLDALNKVRK